MTGTPPLTLAGLLAEYGRIRIPRLQRDYAQGRTAPHETEVRTAFLKALRAALDRPPGAAPLNLDFVYGSAELAPEPHFSPLDGQQRLTTLFLLHWFLAWREGRWDHFTGAFTEGGRSCFAYAVRQSSTEFFDELVRHEPPAAEPDLRAWIADQPWFFRRWRHDPTVAAALEMLEAMRALFDGCPTGLYDRLTDSAQPAVTFLLLDLGDFPLADDLYLKMNARGEPLTPFETLKARYETYLPAHFPGALPRPIGGVHFAMPQFVARRLDTAWTDFFWRHHSEADQRDPKALDASFMNLFRAVALASRDPGAKESFLADFALLRDGNHPPTLATFEDRHWFDPAFSSLLVAVLETWSAGGPLPPGDLFPQLLADPAALTLPHALVWCGYALFLRKNEGRFSPAQLQEWLRVNRHLSLYSDLDSAARFQPCARGLRELLPDSLTLLPRVERLGSILLTGFYDQSQREEALKAGLLLHDPAGWQPLLERAEQHRYFVGQIEFLLDFSGTLAERERTGGCAWDPATHYRFQRSFLGYLEKAEAMFDDEGLRKLYDARWQRALLCFGDYLLLRGQTNFSFLEGDRSKPYSWKRLLRGGQPGSPEATKRPFLKALWDRLAELEGALPPSVSVGSAPTSTITDLLDAIIASVPDDIEPWRAQLVKCGAAVEYSCTIQRDWAYANQVYLLATTQRKGWHAELFTFALERELQATAARQSLAPFTLGAYHYSRLKEDPPFLPLHFSWEGGQRSLLIYGRDGQFELWIEHPIPADLLAIFNGAAFAPSVEFPTWHLRTVAPLNLEPTLRELAALLITQ